MNDTIEIAEKVEISKCCGAKIIYKRLKEDPLLAREVNICSKCKQTAEILGNRNNLQNFLDIYKKNLEYHVKRFPTKYGFSLNDIDNVVSNVKKMAENGTLNPTGEVFVLVARQIGIPYSKKSLLNYIES